MEDSEVYSQAFSQVLSFSFTAIYQCSTVTFRSGLLCTSLRCGLLFGRLHVENRYYCIYISSTVGADKKEKRNYNWCMVTDTRFAVATHIMSVLAFMDDQSVSATFIGEQISINPVIVRRTLSFLGKAGL